MGGRVNTSGVGACQHCMDGRVNTSGVGACQHCMGGRVSSVWDVQTVHMDYVLYVWVTRVYILLLLRTSIFCVLQYVAFSILITHTQSPLKHVYIANAGMGTPSIKFGESEALLYHLSSDTWIGQETVGRSARRRRGTFASGPPLVFIHHSPPQNTALAINRNYGIALSASLARQIDTNVKNLANAMWLVINQVLVGFLTGRVGRRGGRVCEEGKGRVGRRRGRVCEEREGREEGRVGRRRGRGGGEGGYVRRGRDSSSMQHTVAVAVTHCI